MTEVRDEETAARRQQRPEDEPGTGVVTAFGRQLKLLRTRAGLERAEFGKRLGYSADTVASIEQGCGFRNLSSLRRRMRCWGPAGCLRL
jgi:DNA-binding XRE family transcriptional regulator